MILHPSFTINDAGHLAIAGCDAVELAREYGTPAYIMDEDAVRSMCRIYRQAMDRYGDGLPLFAGKALCVSGIYRIIAEEGLGADVVSGGELYTALMAGFPMEKVFFHGNNKPDAEIAMAVDAGLGYFVVDNREELEAVSAAAGKAGKTQKILLRITPGIDPHTHKKVITGSVDSKFGTAIATGQAMELVKTALKTPHIDLCGLHCHIGSQIFESQPFTDAADIMVRFMADIKRETGCELRELNLGGGLGVRYVESDPQPDYAARLDEITARVKADCEAAGLHLPRLMVEPGRSIVAAAGATLYTVGSVKQITGFKNYVSVDGGMPDNPRYALYSSAYTALIADRAGEKADFLCSLAGRCCESGDLLAEDIRLAPCRRGDILAVLVTGAYNYSMASNYNRVPRPPIVMVRGGKPYLLLRRESCEDLIRNDL